MDELGGLDLTQGAIGWSIGNDLWLIRHNRRLIWVIFSPDKQTGIVMYQDVKANIPLQSRQLFTGSSLNICQRLL